MQRELWMNLGGIRVAPRQSTVESEKVKKNEEIRDEHRLRAVDPVVIHQEGGEDRKQVIRPATYNEKLKRKEPDRQGKRRQLQDEATRAWNIMVGMYYKAGGIPWRIPRPETALDTFYLGIGFYRSLDESTMHTSVAQVFNERG
jgi:hypothetical protein